MFLTPLFNRGSRFAQKSPGVFMRVNAGSYDALILDQDGTLLDNMALIAWIDSGQINDLLRRVSGEESRVFARPEDILAPELRSQGFNEKVRKIAERYSIDAARLSAASFFKADILRACKRDRDLVTQVLIDYLAASGNNDSLALRIFPGAESFLNKRHAAGTPMAVGSSNEQTKLESILRASALARFFINAQGAFHAYGGAYFTGSDGKETRRPVKPEPDIFLYAAEQLGVAPERCIVVGDGDADMIAAARAGMLGIGITPEITTLSEYHKKARFLMDSDAAIVVPSWFALDPIVSPLIGDPPLTCKPCDPRLGV